MKQQQKTTHSTFCISGVQLGFLRLCDKGSSAPAPSPCASFHSEPSPARMSVLLSVCSWWFRYFLVLSATPSACMHLQCIPDTYRLLPCFLVPLSTVQFQIWPKAKGEGNPPTVLSIPSELLLTPITKPNQKPESERVQGEVLRLSGTGSCPWGCELDIGGGEKENNRKYRKYSNHWSFVWFQFVVLC